MRTRYALRLLLLAVSWTPLALGETMAAAAGWSGAWLSPEAENSRSVAWGDFDGDGDLDLAAANEGSVNRVYSGNGDGTLSGVWASAETEESRAAAWGDYDGDGDLDLAVGNANQPDRVYRNDGEGSFHNVWSSTDTDWTYTVAWGDMDNDGDLDLAAGRRVYQNGGDGSFSNIWSSTDTSSPMSMAWGDFDRDGDLDIAMGTTFANYVYRNDGSGSFYNVWKSTESENTRAVAWGDYGGDGYLDLAVANYNEVNRVYLNGADGTLVSVWSSAESNRTESVGWGDYDADGDPDLAWADSNAANRVYRNNGDGTFTEAWTSAENETSHCAAWGDYDGDGILDLAVGNSGDKNRVYAGSGFTVNTAPTAPSAGFSAAFSEGWLTLRWGNGSDAETTDADGLTYALRLSTVASGSDAGPPYIAGGEERGSPLLGDYLTPRSSSTDEQRVSLAGFAQLQSDSTYYWQVKTIDTGLSTSAWSARQQAYVEGDTAPPAAVTDLAGTSSAMSRVELAWTSPGDDGGTGTFDGVFRIQYATFTVSWSTQSTPLGAFTRSISTSGAAPSSRHSALFTDLVEGPTFFFYVWSKDDAGYWSEISNTGGVGVRNWLSVWNAAEAGDTVSVAWGDHDGDGDLDLAVGNSGQANRIYSNGGGGAFSPVWASAEAEDTRSVAWGDYDGDGDLDLAAGNSNLANRVYRSEGGGAYTSVWSSGETEDTRSVAWADFDGDGDLDLAAGSAGQPNRVYRNDAGSFVSVWASAESETTYSVSWGDFDNDGDQDLAAGNLGQASRVYRNDGDGVFAAAWASAETEDTTSVAWGDCDGDGDLDLATGVSGGANRVYSNNGDGSLSSVWTSAESETTRAVAWGDYDGDGDLDLATANWTGGAANRVYRNDGGCSFGSVWTSQQTEVTASAAWGDYDGDGILDLAAGNQGSSEPNRVYRGSGFPENSAPSPPSSGFSASVTSGVLTLRWGDGSDAESGDADLLGYELRVSTTLGGGTPAPGYVAGEEESGSPLLGHYATPRTVSPGDQRVSLSLAGLLHSNATYYWQVRTVDTGLARSAWSSVRSLFHSGAPMSISGTAAGVSSVTWSWGEAYDEQAFRVVTAAEAAVSGSLAADTTSWTETGLSTNTAYSRRVVTVFGDSVSTSAAGTFHTLAAPPTSFAFVEVHLTSMTVRWSTNTNPSGTSYQLKRWVTGGSTVTLSLSGTSETLTELDSGTEYFLSLEALNGDGVATGADVELTTRTILGECEQSSIGTGGGVIGCEVGAGAARMAVPDGAFSEPVNVTITAAASLPSGTGSTPLQGTGVGIEVTLDKNLQPDTPVLLTVGYRDSDVAGMAEDRLILGRYDESRAAWVPLASSRDPSANTVSARTDHLSLFQILQIGLASSLSGVTVGPNPLRSGRYPGQVMTFRNLPVGSRVRIYTYLGERIRDFSADAAGMAVWDGRNEAGKQVASGVYIALIDGGGSRTTLKVAVER